MKLIVDFDDFEQGNDRLDLLHRLKDANPSFRCTLFAVPGNTDPEWWSNTPEWCELAMHGWRHPHPRECENWSYTDAIQALRNKPEPFVKLWKSPGWQISDGTYQALVDEGWAVADQPYNDSRRPEGLPVHRLGDGFGGHHLHGHIQDVCGNGLAETFDVVQHFVSRATEFALVSEVVRPWLPRHLVTA